jgi:hypothetical protein
MADVRVTCITKPNPQSPHEHITHIGSLAGAWKLTREEVIASIDTKTNTFYVIDPSTGKRSEVDVVRTLDVHHIFELTRMGPGTITCFRCLSAHCCAPLKM